MSLFYSASRPASQAAPAMVLIHGAGGTHLHWPPQLRHMAEARVIALDLPGHGQSAGRADSIADQAEAVLALLDELKLERAIIGGHSMGGAVALTQALTHPERVAGLVLVSTGARLRVAPAILQQVAEDFTGAVSVIIGHVFAPSAPEALTRAAHAQMLDTDPQVLLSDWQACNAFDVRERLGEIAAPTLALCGSEDVMTPEKYARAFVEKMPCAELKLFSGAGHMLPLEQPDAVTQAIREFINTGPQETSPKHSESKAGVSPLTPAFLPPHT
jgi:pimeloyl-ACP methyl ester carboxylesterase